MGIKPASCQTDSGTVPIDLDGSGLRWMSVAERSHEHWIRDLEKATQGCLAPSIARSADPPADARCALLFRFFGNRDSGRGEGSSAFEWGSGIPE